MLFLAYIVEFPLRVWTLTGKCEIFVNDGVQTYIKVN